MKKFLPEQKGRLTVKELRRLLDEAEANWTEEDVKYLGEFEHNNINIQFFDRESSQDWRYKYAGVGPAKLLYHGGMDIIIVEDRDYVGN